MKGVWGCWPAGGLRAEQVQQMSPESERTGHSRAGGTGGRKMSLRLPWVPPPLCSGCFGGLLDIGLGPPLGFQLLPILPFLTIFPWPPPPMTLILKSSFFCVGAEPEGPWEFFFFFNITRDIYKWVLGS